MISIMLRSIPSLAGRRTMLMSSASGALCRPTSAVSVPLLKRSLSTTKDSGLNSTDATSNSPAPPSLPTLTEPPSMTPARSTAIKSAFHMGYDITSSEITSSADALSGLPRSLIQGYGNSFWEVNDTMINSSVVVLSHTCYSWKPSKFEDITLDSLRFLALLYPTLEILIIGCGRTVTNRISDDIIQHFRHSGTVVEVMDSINASATFNILSSEGRNVAACMLTVGEVTDTEVAAREEEAIMMLRDKGRGDGAARRG